jgi:methyltransferase (TIGR00027 family)
MADGSDLRNIGDTARWVAWYRALESERRDAWFHDPFARRLAGDRGARIAMKMGKASRHAWSFVSRTVVIDRYIERSVAEGATLIVNLAAGLDTRPYRMTLPPTLRWVEVDLPEMLAYKAEMLAGEHPCCDLERIPLNLTDIAARRRLFAEMAGAKTLVITEGLVVYLSAAAVATLASDLAATAGFTWWTLDMVSPRLMTMLQASFGRTLAHAGAPIEFAPREGPAFFERYGWRPLECQSLLHTAKSLHRLSMWFWIIATLFPDSQGRKPDQPWGGVCLFERTATPP